MYVYILRSIKDPDRFYVGLTSDLQKRLAQHNDPNERTWTNRFLPWGIEVFIHFENETQARHFETYLKSHSGRAFLRKHLVA